MGVNMENNSMYFDEKILKYIKENEESSGQEETIDNEKISFTTRYILDKKLSILMPESFLIMDGSIAKIKYPYEDRPQEIYTNEETDINFTFSLEDYTMSSDEIEDVRDTSIELIKKENMGSKFLTKGQIFAQLGEIAYFEVIFKVSDMDIYCNMFFAEVENNVLFGNFNCPKYEMENWSRIVKGLIETITIA